MLAGAPSASSIAEIAGQRRTRSLFAQKDGTLILAVLEETLILATLDEILTLGRPTTASGLRRRDARFARRDR